MALLESLVLPLGSGMEDFELRDPHGKIYRSQEQFGEKGLLVVFTCNHCPYALAVWPRLIRLAHYARKLKINTVAINPNIHPGYPEDAPAKMIEKIKEWGIDFPYLVDESQETAKTFKAQCTPDIFLLNAKKELVYHGRIDDNWQDEKKVTKEALKEALTALAGGLPVDRRQKPSMGCSIKWRD
ncbi:MAG: thioredoxin family protein [Candidatus Omnitrophota bacterium]|nr:thioredoxin family protein [Candidatus Omnitrophota bacterium]MDZ4242707.1 thioredoxin family protein [Candidatus Omnitrophota bacterium]